MSKRIYVWHGAQAQSCIIAWLLPLRLGGCLSFCSLSVTKPCIFTVFWALLQFGHACVAYGPPFFFLFGSALAVHATQTEDAFTSHASRHGGQQWITDGIASGNLVANRCSSSRNNLQGREAMARNGQTISCVRCMSLRPGFLFHI